MLITSVDIFKAGAFSLCVFFTNTNVFLEYICIRDFTVAFETRIQTYNNSINYQMIISKRALNRWLLKLEHGDYQEIERIYGMRRQVAGRAVRSGRMAEKTFFVLQEYFLNKNTKTQIQNTKYFTKDTQKINYRFI